MKYYMYFFLMLMANLSVQTKAQDPAYSVVEVYTGINTIGIGFVWPDQYHIVTALHVVAGRKNFKIRSYTPGQSGFIAVEKVEKILKEADLALLKLEKPLNVRPLEISSAIPDNRNRYYMYRPSPGGTKVAASTTRVESNIERLSFFFNAKTPQLYNALNRQGYPSVSAQIARIIDPVRKGDSGAPVCDENGKVMGIIDGGLYKGLRAYNWAIIASKYLEVLQSPNNQESFTGVQKNDPAIYLVTDNAEDSKPLVFDNGSVNLERVFSTTLGQINATLQLNEEEAQDLEEDYNKTLQKTGKYLSNAKIDVYQESFTGATIAIPHGLTLSFSEATDDFFFLEASSPSGNVKIVFTIAQDADQSLSGEFIDYVLSFDPEADWESVDDEYKEYEEDEYASYDYFFGNDIGGEAAISLLYSNFDFLGLGAYILDDETVSNDDEYYFSLLQECVYLSDFPEY